jgi:ubiquinone/menaquinone biosynthesis C-methylase UbiE
MADKLRPISVEQVRGIVGKHLPVYLAKQPYYQAVMLQSILELWPERHIRLLDVGGGTGVIAEAIAALFPVEEVESIDVTDRFCPALKVKTRSYNGREIPCDNGQFDAATLNNVIHHVPVENRSDFLKEIRRAVAGPVYVKDHLSKGAADHLRLAALDVWGNMPFGGMITASYLSFDDWQKLARDTGYKIGAVASPANYRSGAAALVFPNRLEITMRFDRD